jgi:hypothetical protein
MDFKIKIDLSSQSIINETPKKAQNNKKRNREKGENSEKLKKKPEGMEMPTSNKKHTLSGKKKWNKRSDRKVVSGRKIEGAEIERPKVNANSIISLTLPNNDNLKGDQAQKLSMITKKKPRHWEKRWVLIPNVFEFTKEIWLKKWVLVDGGEDIVDNNVYFSSFL